MIDVNKINHADIPAFLRQKGGIGLEGYQKLVNFGHDPATLQKVIRDTGIQIGPKLQSSMPNRVPAASSSRYTAPGIDNLSAHNYNKVRTSFDQYQATQNRPSGLSRVERSQFDRAAGQARAARQGAQRGGSYGIEDEYRFMISQGFKPTAVAPTPTPTATPEPTAEPEPASPTTLETSTPPSIPTVDTSAADALSRQIADMQAGFQQSMAAQQTQFQQMQAAQEERMAALQVQMQQQANEASAARQLLERPQVLGVQAATGSAGTPMQIARRGVRGAFSRGGMRIQSLNV